MMTTSRKFIYTLVLFYWFIGVQAQEFNEHFTDQTLRIDYIFSGNIDHQEISVDELNIIPGWYGKRQRLSEVPVEEMARLLSVHTAHKRLSTAIPFLHFSKSGFPTTKPRPSARLSKTYFLFLCRKIRQTLLLF